jgi:3-hydroxy-9,10-secoandrosta-1,3,5(10)-triene-9,17-dione monooxygenase reductase component
MGDAKTAPDAATYREAIGHFATGVSVVTSVGRRGPSGLTANAVCSLSLEPLLALVCLDLGSRTLAAVRDSRRLAINVLARDQERLAQGFALKGPEHEKFGGVAWTDVDGLPILDGVIAWVAGDVQELLPGGDHMIGIVTVTRVGASGGEPLVYHRGGYHSLR